MAMHRWRNYAFRYALEAGDFLFLARTEKSKDMNDISTTTNPESGTNNIRPSYLHSVFLNFSTTSVNVFTILVLSILEDNYGNICS